MANSSSCDNIEIWKDIDGFEGLYRISNLGKVFSVRRGKNLSNAINSWGYYCVGLSVKGARKNKKIHRLIAEAFICNLYDKPCINHINGIKSDNDIDNLEWCTQKENMQHAYKMGLLNLKTPNSTSASKPIYEVVNGEVINYKSLTDASIKTGVNHSCISRCCNGKQGSAQGHRFIFTNKAKSK